MKQIICIIILATCLVGFVNLKSTTPTYTNAVLTEGNFEPIAVIELFTSQGCSSCPPADKLLAKTIKNNSHKMVFALSFHVDYWNRLGWVDPFSKAQFSTIQNNYSTALHTNGPYTPQMIVNGKKEFVGSDDEALGNALQNALRSKASSHFKAITTTLDGNKIKINYTLEGAFANSNVQVALVSLMETTVVKRGENGGHTLINDNVVRQLVTTDAATVGEIILDAIPNLAKEQTAIIAYVQQKNTQQITGAVRVIL